MFGNIIGIALTIGALLTGAYMTGTMGPLLVILGCMTAFVVLAPMLGFTIVKTAVLVDHIHQVIKAWYVPFGILFGALGITIAGFALFIGLGIAIAMNLPDSAVDFMQKSPIDIIGTYNN